MQYSMYYACPIIPKVIWAASVEVDVFHPITMLHLCHDYPCVPFSLQVLDVRWVRVSEHVMSQTNTPFHHYSHHSHHPSRG